MINFFTLINRLNLENSDTLDLLRQLQIKYEDSIVLDEKAKEILINDIEKLRKKSVKKFGLCSKEKVRLRHNE